MGHFNFPQLDFESYAVSDTEESSAQLFFNVVNDLFWIQHVKFKTRISNGQQPSLLDLVFLSEIGMVEEIKEMVPIGKSDHVGIGWNFRIEAEQTANNEFKRNYWKGDYEGLNHYLAQCDWSDMIDNEIKGISIDETWTKFKEVIDEGVRRFIPLAGAKSTRKTMIPRTIRSVIKQRNKLWRLYRLTNLERDWENFKTVRNQVRSRLRVWEEDTEREMIRQFKGDKKKFTDM